MIHASNKKALELCHFDQSKHVYLSGSETDLSFGESAQFAVEVHFFCEPNSEPIQPPGHQQGPAQWHGHQVLISKFNGCVSGEYRIGLDAQRHVIFQREVSPWIVTTTDVIPLHEWHSIVCTYDGHFMRIYIDCRHAAHVACGPQKTDLTTPTLIGADLCGYASAHHFEGYISEISMWQRSLDANEVKALSTSNPLSSKTLGKDLIGYWCIYQRPEGSSQIKNGVRLAGEQQFDGTYLMEGAPLLEKWKRWLGGANDRLPKVNRPLGTRDMGPLFGPRNFSHLQIIGAASRLSFGGGATFSLAVQFCPQPSTLPGTHGGPSAAAAPGTAADGSAAGRPGILLSKFHSGLRGEYRLGVDASLRPFFHREVDPWDLTAPRAVTPNEWHEIVATYDGTTMRLFVDRRLATSARSGPQFTDQVTPVLVGAEHGRQEIENHFEGYISELRVWNRALSSDEAAQVFNTTLPKASMIHRGLLGHWRPLDAKLDEPDGRLVVPNTIAARTNGQPTMDALLKRHVTFGKLELTLRMGVRAVLVELGSIAAHTTQWRRAIDLISRQKNGHKHYAYMGTSVSLQKSLLQALDFHAHELLAKRLAGVNDQKDHAMKKLHSELRQKAADVRGRGSQLFKDWFFHNPISHLRECDGDRCEFWRFRYPHRRDAAMQVVLDEAMARFPPRSGGPLILSSFGSGLLFQEFCHVQKLIQAGYRNIRLVLVDTAYAPWKQKYLARDGCCRIYCQPAAELHPDMLRPAPAYSAPGTTKETLDTSANTSLNNAISFVLYNEAIFQFVQWFATEPELDIQVLLYDSVDAYISDCQLAGAEVLAHICSAIDYKDNDKLLEDAVNHMAANTLRPEGVCVKLVTRPGENLPGVFVEDRSRNVLHTTMLGNEHESHFDARCHECVLP